MRWREGAFTLWQAVWGFPQSLVGAGVCLAQGSAPRRFWRGCLVTYWLRESGLALGFFLFLPRSLSPAEISALAALAASGHSREAAAAARRHRMRRERSAKIHAHEYGHAVQSAILGPAYLVLVGIPSALWAGVPAFGKKWRAGERSYYSFGPERSADALGARFSRRHDVR